MFVHDGSNEGKQLIGGGYCWGVGLGWQDGGGEGGAHTPRNRRKPECTPGVLESQPAIFIYINYRQKKGRRNAYLINIEEVGVIS